MELGHTRETYLKILKSQSCKSQLLKVTNQGKPPRMFSLAYNLPKATSNFCPLKLRWKKHMQTRWIFRPSKIPRKKNMETTWIFRHRNYIEKSMWKQSRFFDHRKYIEKSTSKQRRFFDQWNYVKKITWKRRGFFDQQNYIQKVRGNDVEIQICSLTNRRNIDVESISVRRGVPVGNTFQCFMALPLWNPFRRLCDLGKFNYWSLILKNDRLSLYNTIYIFLKFIRAICK